MADLTEIAQLGATPIPGDSPAGESVQYDPDYESLRAEVQKLDSVTGEQVDWGMVLEFGTDILKGRSKHLLVAIYLTAALFKRQDYAGFVCGLGLLRDLIAGFWDTMEPPVKRKRGRIEGFAWLDERCGQWIPDSPPSSGENEELAESLKIVDEIESALKEKLGEDSPSLSDIRRGISAHIKSLEAADKAAAKRREQAAKVAAGEVDGETTADDARKIFNQTKTTIRQICDILRRASNADPVPYRLIRSLTWVELRALPPETDGATQIPPPPPETVARLIELRSKNDWPALIEAAESAFAVAPLWFDIHEMTANALEALGKQHDAAFQAVLVELGGLLERVPGLNGLQFVGGMPFASPQTQKWIDAEVKTRFSQGGGIAGGGGGLPEGLADTTEIARQLAGRGKLEDAVRRMQEGILGTSGHRARFLWRLELARLCLDAGRVMLAAPLLEELEGFIERHQLEEWEPELCKGVYTALLGARRILLKDTRKATPELIAKTNQLHDRLSRLDPTAVLSLDGK